jgi:tripartite-type tricarboxylate transporter receptor subunit TctC
MTFPRRQFLRLAASAAAMPLVSQMAMAQSYPTRPVRIVVGFTVGGIYDTYARLIAQWLSEHLRQSFIIENRTGAGGSIATEAVARAAPDGYTLLFTGSNDCWNTAIYDHLRPATSRPSPASPREWALWSCFRRFPRVQFTNLSPTLGTILPR